jgi:hypothetical protein
MSLLDTIKRWFGSPEAVDQVPPPGPERADETLDRERRERAEEPRPSIASDEGYEASERERDR